MNVRSPFIWHVVSVASVFLVPLLLPTDAFGQFQNTPLASQAPTTGQTGGQAAGGVASGMANTSFGGGFSFDQAFGATILGQNLGAGGTAFRALGAGGAFGLGLGGGFGRGMNNPFGNRSQNQQDGKIRAKITLGFPYAGPPSELHTQTINATLRRLPLPERLRDVQVVIDGEKAIASGNVGSKDDIDILQQLVLLEPGIYEVDISGLQLTDGGPETVTAPLEF